MEYFGRRVRGIVPYTAGEQPRDRRYVKLNTNENPYPPSPAALQVLRAFDGAALRYYPAPDADDLCAAIAEAEGVGRENVLCGNGSDEVLFLTFAAFFDESRGVCFPDITYSFYEVYAGFFGVPVAMVPLRADFTMDLAAMAKAECAGYYIANPNAPTGVGIPAERIAAFAASVPERIVIADEAYVDFYGQSCARLTSAHPNLLVVKTFSKSYSLAGIRCGYAIGNAALIGALRSMKDCMNSYPVDALCQAVCAAAVRDRAYHDETVARVVAERGRLRDALLALGFTVPESKANFLFAGRAAKSGKEIYTRLKEEGVLVRFWDKPVLRDFCRITVGTPEQNNKLLASLQHILFL